MSFSSLEAKRLVVVIIYFLLDLVPHHSEGKVATKGVFSNKTKISLNGNEELSDDLHLPSCHWEGLKKPKITPLKVVIPVIISCSILCCSQELSKI